MVYITFYEGKLMKELQQAFTLAEVLITLGIIGIVAAMTIPNLMTKYYEKQVQFERTFLY